MGMAYNCVSRLCYKCDLKECYQRNGEFTGHQRNRKEKREFVKKQKRKNNCLTCGGDCKLHCWYERNN